MENDIEEFITEDELAGGDNVAPPASNSADSQPAQKAVEDLSLQELNQHLGKNYPTKEAALKSLKDTFSYVGKKTDDVVKEAIDTSKFISRDQYETDMFYSQNPDFNKPELRKVIDSMAKADGVRPRDVVESEAFKQVYGAVKGYNDSQSLKSVLETNPKLANTKSKLGEASEAMKSGNRELASSKAAQAVMDAFEI